jgi:hypothetical protein
MDRRRAPGAHRAPPASRPAALQAFTIFVNGAARVTFLSRRCDRLVTVAEFASQNWELFTQNRVARQNVSLGTPRKRNRRYLIEIKDAKGVSVFFTAADWSDEERRTAVAQILRLNEVPEVYDFSEPSLKAKRGKE